MKSKNYLALRQYRDTLDNMAAQDVNDNPSLFIFMRLVELFQEFDLPVEHVGKIHVGVGLGFFESKKLALDIVDSYVQYCANIYHIILERVNDKEKASQIFGDFIDNNCALHWYECVESSQEPQEPLDEDYDV